MNNLCLSILTLAGGEPSDCLEALRSLADQTVACQLDVVVFASGAIQEIESLSSRFGQFRVRGCATKTFGEAFEQFLELADSPFLTYVEEHSTVAPDWAERILQAHDSGYPIVGFSVLNDNPQHLVSWVHLLGQFGHVAAPIPSGEVGFLAGHHVSYRKELLELYGDELLHLMEDETAFFLRLRTEGVPLYLCGEAVSYHLHLDDMRSLLTLEFHGQRSFAATRARQPNWSVGHTLFYTLLSPILPFVRAYRMIPHAVRVGLLKRFSWKLLPPLTAMLVVGTVGELIGYWFGGGRSAVSKTVYEFERRHMVEDHGSK